MRAAFEILRMIRSLCAHPMMCQGVILFRNQIRVLYDFGKKIVASMRLLKL
jgi:hypothetical protein